MRPFDFVMFIRTARYLRPVQVYRRLWYRIFRPRLRFTPAPRLRGNRRVLEPPQACRSSLVGPSTFRFLNDEATLSFPSGWSDTARDKLWLYNLHYFDDLRAEGAADRADWHRALITRWIADNPPGRGNGWEPYPTSLRIVNWIKWTLPRQSLQPVWSDSLAMQARWLEQRIEWHLLGNHLLANAKALVFAGLHFDGPEAQRWLRKGLAIYARELPEQILADGGHFERSPMYHAIILEDLLDLLNMAGAYPDAIHKATLAAWYETVQRMRAWLEAMTHPDGRIAFFNDAAFGIAAEPAELEAYAARLRLDETIRKEEGGWGSHPPSGLKGGSPSRAATSQAPTIPLVIPTANPSPKGEGGPLPRPPFDVSDRPMVRHLHPSGYVRVDAGPLAAILDCAPIGPDYLPGHAHADTLSFELSLGAERIVVNGGTSVYGTGPQRQRQRGTAAHSTVEVDGADSSEVWAGFRVARRARVRELRVDAGDTIVTIAASHDGYTRLSGRPVHRRQWRFERSALAVTDRIIGRCGNAVARFHLHPDVVVEMSDDRRAGAFLTALGARLAWSSSAPARIEASSWHPEFGLAIPSRCLVVALVEGVATLELRVSA